MRPLHIEEQAGGARRVKVFFLARPAASSRNRPQGDLFHYRVLLLYTVNVAGGPHCPCMSENLTDSHVKSSLKKFVNFNAMS